MQVVGGGSRNQLLNQTVADVTGLPVIAGPVEATALGNLLVQLIALGAKSRTSPRHARWCARVPGPEIRRVEPSGADPLAERYGHYHELVERGRPGGLEEARAPMQNHQGPGTTTAQSVSRT